MKLGNVHAAPAAEAPKASRASAARKLGVLGLIHTTTLEGLLDILKSGAIKASASLGTKSAAGSFNASFVEAVFKPNAQGGGGAERLQFYPGGRLATLVFDVGLIDDLDFRAAAPWAYGKGTIKPSTVIDEMRANKDTWRAQNELGFKAPLGMERVKEILVHPSRRGPILAELKKSGIAPPPGKTWEALFVRAKGSHFESVIPQARIKPGNSGHELVPGSRSKLLKLFGDSGVDPKRALPSDAASVRKLLPHELRAALDTFDILDLVKTAPTGKSR
ncbi:MAG: hypothetical protein U1E65_08880 [Myxococcota bacterium]